MDKQMIEEMAKEINHILFKECKLNIGGRCEDCECFRKETKDYDCQSYLVAKLLLGRYQPKIHEAAVVLTREEYDEFLRQGAMIDFLKECNKEVCKGTAEKFAERLKKAICDNTYPYFDKDGKAVNIWKAIEGYDKIDEICKELVEGV